MAFKLLIALSLVAICNATVSGDYGSIGVQADQTIRSGLNTISSYSKAVNTAHSQSFVSRQDLTSNPGIIAHPLAAIAPVASAPIIAAHHGYAPALAHGYAPALAHGAYPYAYKAAAAPVLYH